MPMFTKSIARSVLSAALKKELRLCMRTSKFSVVILTSVVVYLSDA